MSNNEITFSILDPNNEQELNKYEKGLYKAFSQTIPDKWILEHYITKTGNRLCPFIPYDELLLFQGYLGDTLVCANAINIAMKQTQIEKIGFSYSADKLTVEGVHMFLQNIEGEKAIQAGDAFFTFVMADLKQRGYKKLVSQCPGKLKALYHMFEFEFIDEVLTDDEKRFLIQCTI